MSQPDYAAIAVLSPRTGRWELMSSGGRVIVFDTARVAWEWLPLLGQGRPCRLDARTGSVEFAPMSALLPNRARIVSPYRPDEKMPWRKHIIWSEWYTDCELEIETLGARDYVRARLPEGVTLEGRP